MSAEAGSPAGPPPAAPPATSWRPWLFALLLCLPYWLVWLAPCWTAPAGYGATGFPQDDQPYYVANGRAIFERGNGLAGPNPYDPDPAAPAIYFHLLNWVFGLLVVGFKLDPGLVYAGIGLAAGLLFARLTLALIGRLAAESRAVPWLGALALWGGGIAFLGLQAAVRGGLIRGGVGPLAFEPAQGWWLLPWGRNLVYGTEAVYHCLVLGIFLAFTDRRWWRLTGLVALLAACHPFTGAQVLLAVGAFTGLSLVAPAATGLPRLPWKVMAALAAIAAAFGLYNLVFLPSFPQHAALLGEWALDWQEKWWETLGAYLPLFLAVLLAARRGLLLAGPERVFFGIFAAVSFVLTQHGRFAPPHQPLHFGHGYLWFPLFLLALPWLERGARWAAAGGGRQRAAAALVIALAAADNAVFVARSFHHRPGQDVRHLDHELREIYRLLDREGLDAVLVSNDPVAGYLAATYSPARPFYGHPINTPQAPARRAQLAELFGRGRASPELATAPLLLLRGALPAGQQEWQPLYQGERWSLYQRRR